MRAFFLLIPILFLLASCNSADSNRQTILEVTGEAELSIKPTKFVLSPEVILYSNNQKSVYDSISLLCDSIVAAVKAIDDSVSISVEDVSISTTNRWQSNENIEGKFTATTKLKISSRKVELASEIMRACIHANATEVGLPVLSADKSDSLCEVLRKNAFDNAMTKAKESAKNYNARLGKIVSIRSSNSFPISNIELENRVFGESYIKSKNIVSSLFGEGGFAELTSTRTVNITESVDIYYILKW